MSLAGCAVPPPDRTDSTDSAPASDDSGDFNWNVQPEWTGDEAVLSVESALELGFPDPLSLLEDYQAMMAAGDESCPGDDTQLMGDLVPREGCTSESGYFYSGVAAYTETSGTGSFGPLFAFHLDAGFRLIDDQSMEYEAGGNVLYSMERSEELSRHQWSAQVEGSWVYGGAAPWFDAGISASLSLGGTLIDGQQIDKAWGTLGMAGSWFAMDEMTWDSSCGDQPFGVLGIRDPSGLWIWIELDSDCSGCGTGTWDGTGEVEELCVDLRPIQSVLLEMAESDPWS
jgi:hypothetical protein